MDRQNLCALLMSYGYLIGLLLVTETTRRLLGVSGFVTRKVVLIGVGMWSIETLRLFTSWKWGIVPPLTMALLFYLSYRYDIFEAIEDSERVNLGMVFFPLAFAVLLGFLWRPGSAEDAGYIAVAGLMATTWGDTMAAIIGRRYGTRRYGFFGHPRTMEGTLALFFASSATMAPVLALMGGMEWHQSVAFALIAGTAAASIETASFYGSDNFSVPVAAAVTLYLLTRLS